MALVPENSLDRGEITEIFCSVCIANYNGEEYIGQCIESVLNQDVDLPLEIIIHDDASTDNSVSFIKTNYPQVILLESKENKGFCISNNRMVEIAKGENILLLNNDAALHQDALRTLQEALVKYGDGIYGLPQYNMETGELIDIGSIFDPFFNPVPNLNKKRQDVGMIIGACLFLPNKLWKILGGLPPWFESLAEDMYICCVARLQGYPVKAIARSGFDHWIGRSLGGGKVTQKMRLSTTLDRRARSERNKTFVMILTSPSVIFYPLICCHFILLVFEGVIVCSLQGNKKVLNHIYIQTFMALWNKRKTLKKLRRETQLKRVVAINAYLRVYTCMPHKLKMLIRHGIPEIK